MLLKVTQNRQNILSGSLGVDAESMLMDNEHMGVEKCECPKCGQVHRRKMTVEERKEQARKAAAKRWEKKNADNAKGSGWVGGDREPG